MFHKAWVLRFAILVTSFALSGAVGLRAQTPSGTPLAILQGLTDDTTTQLAVVVPVDELFHYELSAAGQPKVTIGFERRLRADSNFAVDQVKVSGLVPGVWYDLRVLDDRNNLRDRRQLRSLELSRPRVKFAFASCVNDNFEATETWVQLSKDRPEFLLMVGDNVYADHLGILTRRNADPAQLWQRYAETWNNVALFKLKKLIPTLATWDDHDYGVNNGDRTYAFREESMDIMMTFFAQDSRGSKVLTPGPGVATLFQAFGQNFFLLDDRSFRTEMGSTESTHWGRDQENWIAEQAQRHPQPTWIFNGSQFFGAYTGKESVEGEHFDSLERLRRNLKKLPQVFVFGSGDVHFSEVMEIEDSFLGYPTLELTSSSINGWYIRWMDRALSNPRRLQSVATHNYILVESVVTATGLKIDAASRSAGDVENFRIRREVQQSAR